MQQTLTNQKAIPLHWYALIVCAGSGFAFGLVALSAIIIGLSEGKGFSHRAVAGAFGLSVASSVATTALCGLRPRFPEAKVKEVKQKPQSQPTLVLPEQEEEETEVDSIEEILQTIEFVNNNHDIYPQEQATPETPESTPPASGFTLPPISTASADREYKYGEAVLRPLPATENSTYSRPSESEYGSNQSVLPPVTEEDYWG